jgi:NADH-quinone oxidoreductase subunit G
MGLPGFDFETSQDVLSHLAGDAPAFVSPDRLNNKTDAPVRLSQLNGKSVPVVASIYQTDSLVRRATALQLTADAKAISAQQVLLNPGVAVMSHD